MDWKEDVLKDLPRDNSYLVSMDGRCCQKARDEGYNVAAEREILDIVSKL
jgi:hypothetical protein